MVNRYARGPQQIAATVEFNNDTDEAKVKFFVNGDEYAFIISQGNLEQLIHKEGEAVGYLLFDAKTN